MTPGIVDEFQEIVDGPLQGLGVEGGAVAFGSVVAHVYGGGRLGGGECHLALVAAVRPSTLMRRRVKSKLVKYTFSITVCGSAIITTEFSPVLVMLLKCRLRILPMTGFSGSSCMAVMLIGSPWPHQSPVWRRVSMWMLSKATFSNGWIADEDGRVLIYYASSDSRMHVAESTVDRLVDYCLNTPADGLTTALTVERLNDLIDRNMAFKDQWEP